MAGKPLKVYDVKIGTTTVQMKLSEEDARRKGLIKDPPARKAPARRRTTAKNKKVDVEPEATGGE